MNALDRIRTALGPLGTVEDPQAVAPYLADRRGRGAGAAALVARPASTEEVAAVVRICAEARIALVPQGGNTGLMGGGIPDGTGTQVLLNLGRMNRIRDLDPVDNSLVAEAGCVLATVQAAAEAADRQFPLSLGSEGTAQIGGLISTNAGGTMTIRHGNMREQVLGIEAVLPDGRIWNGLRRLRKDNTGYDLKHLFIGGEGTLGIITAAVLRLQPRPRQIETALCAIPDPASALALLDRCRTAMGDALRAFELMPRMGIDMALKHVPGTADPFSAPHPWYVLVEVASPSLVSGFRETLEGALQAGLEADEAVDALIAESGAQRAAFWRLREALVEGRRKEGAGIHHDISVPTSRVPAFLDQAGRTVETLVPGIRIVAFGHLGDGNLHYNLNAPVGSDAAAFLARTSEVNRLVHDIVRSFGGSISAEHGIGVHKRDELARAKDPLELELMRRIKAALDPLGILNPGKVL
ncbi:MAG TPA: FAD-binding oxidoreductase [Azospirillaceae bacterium]|nr:FAD-binding oxidoreductase [Azospirillaceae bacterium]